MSQTKSKQWNEIICAWENETCLKYPKNIKNRFVYETSMCDNNLTNKYQANFIEMKELDNIKTQNFKPFMSHINESKNIFVTSFYNISEDTRLIIPIPRQNKNFSTIKDFIDNATITQQQHFWNHVSKEILLFLTKNENVFVSTHGLGVHYFHIRLCTRPKYYKTKQFIEQHKN
jgi:hypothetical protein